MSSEYSLQLKAVLDTSDVQSKLQQLKSSQQSGAGGSLGGGSIQHVLQRLNSTLMRLQTSIDRLSRGGTSNARDIPRYANGSQYLPFLATSKQTYDRQWRQRNRRWFSGLDPEDQKLLKQSGYKPGSSILSGTRQLLDLKSRQSVVRTQIGAAQNQYMAGMAQYVMQNPNLPSQPAGYYWKQLQYNRVIARNRPQADEMLGFAGRFGRIRGAFGRARTAMMSPAGRRFGKMGLATAGIVLDSASNYAEAKGHSTTAKALSFGSNVLVGAGMGAAAGSVIPGIGTVVGAGIGAAGGALKSTFDLLADSANKAASALDSYRQRISTGVKVDKSLSMMFRDQADRTALESGDRSYFENQLAKEQKTYDKLLHRMDWDIGLKSKGVGSLTDYERTTAALYEERGKNDPTVKRRKMIADRYKADALRVQEADARIVELQNILKSLPKAAIDQTRADRALEEVASLKEALASLHAPDMSNVNSLASQGYMVSAADDEARLDEANKHLRDIVNLTRQIKDKEEEAAVYGS